jgi:hypothetical protein
MTRLKRDVLLNGDRDRRRSVVLPPDRIDGRKGWNVYLIRVRHTDGGRYSFERQCDRRGVEWDRVKDDSGSVYEVWGPIEAIERLSREKMVIPYDAVNTVLLSIDYQKCGYQRPSPFAPCRG